MCSVRFFCIGIPVSSRIANNLEKMPGIEKALKSPIIDVDQAKVATVMERVILSLEKEVPTGCKDSLLVQTITGMFDYMSDSGVLKRSITLFSVQIYTLYFAGIVRSRVSRTLYNCATKITPTAKPVYVELKQKIQDKVIQILQNVGGEWRCTKAFRILQEYINRTRLSFV